MTSNDPLESVTLTFPPGAVDTNTTVTYTHHTSPPATISTSSSSDLQGIGVYFDLEAEQGGVPVTSFNLPVTLTVRYLTSGAVDPNTLGLFRYDGGSWDTDGITQLAHENNIITSTVTHFSTFGLLGEGPQQIYLPLLAR